MAELKVLGQVNPAAGVMVVLYTVPASRQTTASNLVVCNSGGAATFRVSVAVAGSDDELKQYIFRDTAIAGNSTFSAGLDLTLGTGDVIRVQPGSASLIFNLFGVEIVV